AAPHRTDGVNHVARAQAEAGRHLGVAGLAAAERAARLEQFAPGRAMDRAVHAAAAEQRRVGGVDDGVDVQRRQVALPDLDALHRCVHSTPNESGAVWLDRRRGPGDRLAARAAAAAPLRARRAFAALCDRFSVRDALLAAV